VASRGAARGAEFELRHLARTAGELLEGEGAMLVPIMPIT
jgi:hypothetical protein